MFAPKTSVDAAIQACQATIDRLNKQLAEEQQSLVTLEYTQSREEQMIASAKHIKSLLEHPIAFPYYIDTIKNVRERQDPSAGLKAAKTEVDALIGRVARGEQSAYDKLLGFMGIEEQFEPSPCSCTFCVASREIETTAKRIADTTHEEERQQAVDQYVNEQGTNDPYFDSFPDAYSDSFLDSLKPGEEVNIKVDTELGALLFPAIDNRLKDVKPWSTERWEASNSPF